MTKATINKTNRWVYICADPEGAEFVKNEMGLDPVDVPTTEIDNDMYFTFSPDFKNYDTAWMYAKEATVQNFNDMAEKSLKDAGLPVWSEVEPKLRQYIKETDPKTKSEGDYVYNFIDSLMDDIRYQSGYDSIAEDYYLNMVYSDEEFLRELDKAYPVDIETEGFNVSKIKDAFELSDDNNDYGCDYCGTRASEKDITWFYGASIGLCPECVYRATRADLEQLDATGDIGVLSECNNLQESTENSAYEAAELEKLLRKITSDFTKDSGKVETGFEDEKATAVEILKKHYKVVEVSDARRAEGEEPSWCIAYAERLTESFMTENDKAVATTDVIKLVSEHFGITDEPYRGPTFILPNGLFLDLRKCSHHSDVERWLIDNGYSNNEFGVSTGSRSLYDLGCIRCDTAKYYIAISDIKQVTPAQYNTLLVWLDFLSKYVKRVEVITGDNQHIGYTLDSMADSDVVIDKIRHYYIYGQLREAKDKDTIHAGGHVYERNRIGCNIEMQTKYIKESARDIVNRRRGN